MYEFIIVGIHIICTSILYIHTKIDSYGRAYDIS